MEWPLWFPIPWSRVIDVTKSLVEMLFNNNRNKCFHAF